MTAAIAVTLAAGGGYAAIERGDDDASGEVTASTVPPSTDDASVVPSATASGPLTTVTPSLPTSPSPTIPLPSISLPPVTPPSIDASATATAAVGAAPAPGPPLPTGQPPDSMGSDATLDDLADACYAGVMAACDALYLAADSGSSYRVYGDTCAGRQPALTGLLCVDAFPAPPTTTG